MGEPVSLETSWEPGRRFVLRVAGLPVETVHALRGAESRRWADEVLAAEDRLLGRGALLSDALHDLVKATGVSSEEEALRRRLLALRRQVFNNRLPGDPEAAARMVGDLDRETGRIAADWIRDRQHLGELRAEGTRLVAADLDRTRAELRRLVSEDRLRMGLLLASPTLDGQLDAFVDDRSARPDKRLRKVERSVLAYLYRTACKTSPFSTFTGVALGRFGDGGAGSAAGSEAGAGVGRTVRIDEQWSSHVRLNVVVLGRLAELVLADPVRRADLPVALASGWGREQDRVRYVRRWVTAGDDEATVAFESVRDRLFFLRRSGVLEQLLDYFEQRPSPTYRDLVDRLEAEHGAERESCERYVAALLEVGMVQAPCLETDVHTADPLGSFQDALRALHRPWADRLAACLDGPADCLARYPAAGVAERRTLLRDLRAGLRAAQAELGSPEATLPQTLLYEDVSAGTGTEVDLRAWTEPSGGALRAVEGILPAFDLTLPQRLTFKGFFVARYGRGGRCDDLLTLVHNFHEDFYEQYVTFSMRRKPFDEQGEYVPEENWLGLAGIKAIDAGRRTLIARMRERWAAVGGTDREIRLTERHLAEVAAELAPAAPEFAPQSHHIQLTEEDGEPLVVLNSNYGGLCFPFSRFTHVYDGPGGSALSDALRAETARIQPEGAVLAEVTGGTVTSNLNLHGRLTEYEIVCPGETSSVPEQNRIRMDDLYVEHDADTDRLVLRSTRLGREVVPIYVGYLVPLALPELPRTLLLLSPSSMAPPDLWAGVPEGEARDGVTSRPRVRHGAVVLSRRSWTTTGDALPARAPGGTDAEWFLDWQRWRSTHGLPDQVFATVASGPRGAAGAKPQYVDFSSHLSLTALDALVKGPDTQVVLREMLPAENGLHVVSRRGTHVAELAVETYSSTRRAKDDPTCRT
ncbi:lantibiotic dehydratase [Streptacidiphilus sp. N1-3]|uniref:Lantibiotic dehydratase n=1 Tax=Streptacidiphilus alkalitolerans TaxID=3342712 RepID=A0ABV6X941_9ACTN